MTNEHDITYSQVLEIVRIAIREAMDRTTVDQEARGMCRDLKQIYASHERYCVESKRNADLRADKADAQRLRIEDKLDEFIASMGKKEARQLAALVAILLAALTFFLIPYFTRH